VLYLLPLVWCLQPALRFFGYALDFSLSGTILPPLFLRGFDSSAHLAFGPWSFLRVLPTGGLHLFTAELIPVPLPLFFREADLDGVFCHFQQLGRDFEVGLLLSPSAFLNMMRVV